MPNEVAGRQKAADWRWSGEERPSFVKNHGQSPAPKSAKLLLVALGKGVGNCRSERQRDLTTLAPDAGASPGAVNSLAAIHSLVDRASAGEVGVQALGILSKI